MEINYDEHSGDEVDQIVASGVISEEDLTVEDHLSTSDLEGSNTQEAINEEESSGVGIDVDSEGAEGQATPVIEGQMEFFEEDQNTEGGSVDEAEDKLVEDANPESNTEDLDQNDPAGHIVTEEDLLAEEPFELPALTSHRKDLSEMRKKVKQQTC